MSGAVQDVVDDFIDALEEIEENLLKLPSLAVLLPVESDQEAKKIWEGLRSKGVGVELGAHTTYLNRPRTLWILHWEKVSEEAITPALHLNRLVHLISEETEKIRPSYGPWLWPLTDGEVSSAIALCGFVDPKVPWWRKALWAVRLLPPENGSILERCLLEHYGRETGYVFAWANLFTRGLWALALPGLIYGLIAVDIQMTSLLWYSLQLITVLWGLCITMFGSSRRSVLSTGAGLCRPVRAEQMGQTTAEPEMEADKLVDVVDADLALPNQVDTATVRLPVEKAKQEPIGKAKAKKKLRPRDMMMVQARCLDSSEQKRISKVFAPEKKPDPSADKELQQVVNEITDYRVNPEYKPEHAPVRRAFFAAFVTMITLTLFLSLAALVLSLLLQLKSYLIFEWGECLKRHCDNAGAKWGFSAVLVDIAVDILMALVFMVGLGESCKAIAFQLARLWNFHRLRRRLTVQTLISLCIEVMAKVGLFALLAFLFLPSWSEHSVQGSDELPNTVCEGLIDYDVCRALFCNANSDPYCCSGTLSCARQLLPFTARRSLFENWLVGPFVVAPFVDLIPALLAPLLAQHLADLADAERRTACRKCCCLSCGWLARFLAFIFILDGEVTGIRYVCLGKTFRDTKIFSEDVEEEEDYLEGAFEQAVLRPWDAFEELKELKLSFIFVLLFAPLKPILILPTLLARLVEVRAKLQKLFLVKRRNIPRDARLVHRPQELFCVFATMAACFWHIGLALISFNMELHRSDAATIAVLWLGGGLMAALVVFLLYRLIDRDRGD